MRVTARWLLLSCFSLACDPSFPVVDRADGEIRPLTAACDPLDPGRCLLPWPSSTFTVLDETTATGVRLEVDSSSINPRDVETSLARADGFSRVTPILSFFDGPLDPSSLGAVRLFLAEHDHDARGSEVPLRAEMIEVEDGTLITADPRRVLEANADYVAVIDDSLRYADGSTPVAPRAVEVALALVPPADENEAALTGYHAPTRRLLEDLGIDPLRVVRVWDFRTRSDENPRRAFRHIREASIAALGASSVVIDSIETSDDPNVALIAHGRVTGLPNFLNENFGLVIGADGLPSQTGTIDAPFRALIPAGEGDYRFVIYGHGTAGNELDDAFDEDLAGLGVAKVNVRLYGWTDIDTLATFARLQNAIEGSDAAAAQLALALGHAAAIQRAMAGALGDALAADTIAAMPNPAAGRRPDSSNVIWAGGSLGGTTGLVYASADPDVRYAILNVPGAAWTQWIWESSTFVLIKALLQVRYRNDADLAIGLAIAQTNLDMADGASWSDVAASEPNVFLIQESMGDPILPNPGTEMVAVVARARHVGGVLEEIAGVEPIDEALDASAITQFRAPDGDTYAVHGFAARDTAAGVAAREQFRAFLESAWAGRSIIAPPPSCPNGVCDFGSP